jgi:hypothetical protein
MGTFFAFRQKPTLLIFSMVILPLGFHVAKKATKALAHKRQADVRW